MIGYNPSHLNKNETLLEAFHRVEAYLKANPQYQVYQSSAQYQEGTQEYLLNTIIVPEGSKVGAGDVVLFSNVYYAVITSVSETTFSIEPATNFRGTDGTDGVTPDISVSATVDNNVGTPLVVVTKNGTKENPSFILNFQNLKGKTGATGEKGETGLAALTYSKTNAALQAGTFPTDLDGYNRTPLIGEICGYFSTAGYCGTGIIQEINSNIVTVRTVGKVSTTGPQGSTGDKGDTGPKGDTGNAIYLYNGLLDSSVTEVPSTQVTIPEGRRLQSGDILISTYKDSFGALASVFTVMGLGGTATVEFIGNLSTGGGGTTLNKYTLTLNGGNYGLSYQEVNHVYRIREKCKGDFKIYPYLGNTETAYSIPIHITSNSSNAYIVLEYATVDSGKNILRDYYIFGTGGKGYRRYRTSFYNDTPAGTTTYYEDTSNQKITIVYYNDTEIT